MRYENEVEVHPTVFHMKSVCAWCDPCILLQ